MADGRLALAGGPASQISDGHAAEATASSAEVEPELVVAEERARTPADERAVEEREVDAADHHEERDHPLGRGRERLDRARVGRRSRRSAASRRRSETASYRPIRSSTPVQPSVARRATRATVSET